MRCWSVGFTSSPHFKEHLMSHAKFKIRRLPIDELKPAPYNPRTHWRRGPPPAGNLAASRRDSGPVGPLVWNELSGHVVGGHARLRILREMGVKEVLVSVVRLSPVREKALNIVLNN